jgi:RNA polymerase sigma-70 factor (ECF subfamily)
LERSFEPEVETSGMTHRDPLRKPEEAITRLYAYVAYRLGPGPDAEDVVSETIERALRYRSSYDPSTGSPIAWMIGIAKRCIADALSERGRRVDIPVDELGGVEVDFSSEVVARSDIHRAMDGLEDRDRELIALRYGADLSARDIGALLDLRTNTVEVALHRALGKLRDSLEGSGPSDEPTNTSDLLLDS